MVLKSSKEFLKRLKNKDKHNHFDVFIKSRLENDSWIEEDQEQKKN